jgi:hypothetical protein
VYVECANLEGHLVGLLLLLGEGAPAPELKKKESGLRLHGAPALETRRRALVHDQTALTTNKKRLFE